MKHTKQHNTKQTHRQKARKAAKNLDKMANYTYHVERAEQCKI